MNKILITAALVLMTGAAASAQNNRSGRSVDTNRIAEQDTALQRTRWDNPTTDDPNSLKTRPGVEMQMDNGTRQDQREFKNTVDTPGSRRKLPRR